MPEKLELPRPSPIKVPASTPRPPRDEEASPSLGENRTPTLSPTQGSTREYQTDPVLDEPNLMPASALTSSMWAAPPLIMHRVVGSRAEIPESRSTLSRKSWPLAISFYPPQERPSLIPRERRLEHRY